MKVNFILLQKIYAQLFLYFLGNEAEVEGTLSVQPQANPVEGFEEYFLNLTVQSNTRNPWFTGKNWIFQFLINKIVFDSEGLC